MEDFFIVGLIMFIAVLVAIMAVCITFFAYFAVEGKKKKDKLRGRAYLSNGIEQAVRTKLPAYKVVYLIDNYSYQKGNEAMQKLFYDEKAKKVAMVNDLNGEITVVDFKEIIGYEIIENYAGNTCKELGLSIKLDSMEKPFIKYDLYFKQTIGMGRDSDMCRACKESIMTAVAVLEKVREVNRKNA
ncbi:MAG: hypothetical protein IKC37_04725 [Clostridia bacterium]|nr:hypothetical protein [Clostridia bacterium]